MSLHTNAVCSPISSVCCFELFMFRHFYSKTSTLKFWVCSCFLFVPPILCCVLAAIVMVVISAEVTDNVNSGIGVVRFM